MRQWTLRDCEPRKILLQACRHTTLMINLNLLASQAEPCLGAGNDYLLDGVGSGHQS